MNSDFSRIITLLRKERKISQKQAASELNISQALLSHYEKGIRECGLDFVVKTADFYNVSCDYLLGRSPEKNGATVSFDDILENENSKNDNKMTTSSSVFTVLNKKLIYNSLDIVFDALVKLNNKHLTTAISNYFMLAVYHVFRAIYAINPQNDKNLFTVPENIEPILSSSKMLEMQSEIIKTIGQTNKDTKIEKETLTYSSESLKNEYGISATSLLNLIKITEQNINQNKI